MVNSLTKLFWKFVPYFTMEKSGSINNNIIHSKCANSKREMNDDWNEQQTFHWIEEKGKKK